MCVTEQNHTTERSRSSWTSAILPLQVNLISSTFSLVGLHWAFLSLFSWDLFSLLSGTLYFAWLLGATKCSVSVYSPLQALSAHTYFILAHSAFHTLSGWHPLVS